VPANESLQPVAVGSLDADAGVQAEPTAVFPAQHVLGVVGFQEAMADHVAEDPLSDREL
jgi:hypothetical protein